MSAACRSGSMRGKTGFGSASVPPGQPQIVGQVPSSASRPSWRRISPAASGIAGAIVRPPSGGIRSKLPGRCRAFSLLGERPRLRRSMKDSLASNEAPTCCSALDGSNASQASRVGSPVLSSDRALFLGCAPSPGGRAPARNSMPPELVRHRERAVEQVAEIVAEVRLVALEQRLVSEVAVAAERVLAQHEVAQRIDAELGGDGDRVDARRRHRLRDLLALHRQVAVAEDLLGRRQPGAHQQAPASRRRGSGGCPWR